MATDEKSLAEIHGEVLRERAEARDREYPQYEPEEADRLIEDLQAAICFALEHTNFVHCLSGYDRERLQDSRARLIGALPQQLRERYE